MVPRSDFKGFGTGILGDPGGVSRAGRKGARRKFSSTGGGAPGYRFSPDHFQTVKRILPPDLAQKNALLLCPIGEQYHVSFFREFVHDSFRRALSPDPTDCP